MNTDIYRVSRRIKVAEESSRDRETLRGLRWRFSRFTGGPLKPHLKVQPPGWLATLIQMSPAGRDATDAA